MPMKSLESLFLNELKDAYDAERRISKALPKMVKAASSEELRAVLQAHLQQTGEHIQRLDLIFDGVEETPGRKTCAAMVGLLEEAREMMEEEAPDAVKDAALIAAAQKVEHYEMATYGCLRDWAELLGNEKAVELLQQTLNEEGEADRKLTKLSQSLNVEAAEEEEEEEVVTAGPGAGAGRRHMPNGRAATSTPTRSRR